MTALAGADTPAHPDRPWTVHYTPGTTHDLDSVSYTHLTLPTIYSV